jgi:hypothetical protein
VNDIVGICLPRPLFIFWDFPMSDFIVASRTKHHHILRSKMFFSAKRDNMVILNDRETIPTTAKPSFLSE